MATFRRSLRMGMTTLSSGVSIGVRTTWRVYRSRPSSPNLAAGPTAPRWRVLRARPAGIPSRSLHTLDEFAHVRKCADFPKVCRLRWRATQAKAGACWRAEGALPCSVLLTQHHRTSGEARGRRQRLVQGELPYRVRQVVERARAVQPGHLRQD